MGRVKRIWFTLDGPSEDRPAEVFPGEAGVSSDPADWREAAAASAGGARPSVVVPLAGHQPYRDPWLKRELSRAARLASRPRRARAVTGGEPPAARQRQAYRRTPWWPAGIRPARRGVVVAVASAAGAVLPVVMLAGGAGLGPAGQRVAPVADPVSPPEMPAATATSEPDLASTPGRPPVPTVPGAPGTGRAGRGGRGASRPPAGHPARGPVVVYAVAGTGCPRTSTSGYREIGAYRDGDRGWYSRPGGWSGSGCAGAFTAVPMSGDASLDDRTASVVWSFRITEPRARRCAVAVYVPRPADQRDAGARAAQYRVTSGDGGPGDTELGRFTVDQPAHPGRWVRSGTYPLTGGRLAVVLTTRGADPSGEHIAAAQVSVHCRGGRPSHD